MSKSPGFSDEATRAGTLPPWEVAQVCAFATVIDKMAETLDLTAAAILGMTRDAFIATQVEVKGGGHPTARTIEKTLAKCRGASWRPGKTQGSSPGRPPVYSAHVKQKVAEVAMELKRKNIAPIPRRVRARLPNLTINPETGGRMCDKTFHVIYSTLCYDVEEDDPWQYLPCPSQDILPSDLLPKRVACAKHIERIMPSGAWYNQVAFDPCYTLLPKTIAKLEELQVRSMGKNKWTSKGALRDGNNLRAPATAMTQGSASVRVDWTVVFARGKVRIVVIDRKRAARDPSYPAKLTDAENVAKFIRAVLPVELEGMRKDFGWANLPRTVVHDKASYMNTYIHERLNVKFAAALDEAGFVSWVGGNHASTAWLVAKWGDVYLHETVISHVRRLLGTDFSCDRLGETPSQFVKRMKKVERYMNSDAFAASNGGRGLAGLAKDLPARCKQVIKRKGQRIPK